MNRLPSIAAAVVLIGLAVSLPTHSASIARCADHVPDSYIVTLRDSVLPPATEGRVPRDEVVTLALQIQQEYGGLIQHIYDSALHGFALDELSEVEALRLSADPRIDYMEENCILHPSGTTTQWYPENWGLDRIDERNLPMDDKYTYDRVGWKVHVYVLDFFIHEHQEFEGRVRDRTDCLGNAQKEDPATWSCEHPASYTGTPENTHATAVAGVVGSEKYGVAKEVNLHSVRVCSKFDCEVADVIAAINWVRNNRKDPALVNINLNYEACKTNTADTFLEIFGLRSAIESAISENIAVVLSAGNCDIDACNAPPANTNAAIVVAATDTLDRRSVWTSTFASNYGSCVDLFAPGTDIVTTSFDGSGGDAEQSFNGTSFASPHVAGIAALYLLTNTAATPAEVEQFLIDWSTKNVVTDPQGSPNRLLFSPFGALAD